MWFKIKPIDSSTGKLVYSFENINIEAYLKYGSYYTNVNTYVLIHT